MTRTPAGEPTNPAGAAAGGVGMAVYVDFTATGADWASYRRGRDRPGA